MYICFMYICIMYICLMYLKEEFRGSLEPVRFYVKK